MSSLPPPHPGPEDEGDDRARDATGDEASDVTSAPGADTPAPERPAEARRRMPRPTGAALAAATGRVTSGIAGWFGRHRTGVAAGAATLGFLLLAAGAFGAGVASASGPDPTPTPSATSVDPTARPTPGTLAEPSRVRTCSIAPALGVDGLPGLVAAIRTSEGESLLDRSGADAVAPGGTAQILTAASALAVLGPDFRIPTDVTDTGAGAIALVGHGDPTLSALPSGQNGVYPGAAHLSDLAQATVQAWAVAHPGSPITRLTLDSTWWAPAESWDPAWDAGLRSRGTLGFVTALQVDGDRTVPTQADSARGEDPIGRAGDAFSAALKTADPTGTIVSPTLAVDRAAAPTAGNRLAEVQSPALSDLIAAMLASEDATLAEALARVTSVDAGARGTTASVASVQPQALAEYDIDTTGVVLRDGSGLDPGDRVPADYLARLLGKVAASDQNLGAIRAALPIAGQSGVLASRFEGAAARARGHVLGLDGAPAGGATLAGIAIAADGTQLPFMLSTSGDGLSAAALDTAVAAAYRCGGNLAPY